MGNEYAGDVSVAGAWEFLSSDKNAVLVDVRTPQEWGHTGVPDLEISGKQPMLLSWRIFPDFGVNPNFLIKFGEFGLRKDAKILLLCKAGGRSREAAMALTAEGYTSCFNVAGGMEDNNGWMASGFPVKNWVTNE